MDVHVGSRVRLRRMLLGMSQEKLGEHLGLTFQQVQKYEKGVNRIGAGRLQRISEKLDVPITFFFGATPHAAERGAKNDQESVFELMQTAGSVRMVKAFHKIKSPRMRQTLVSMAEEMAEI